VSIADLGARSMAAQPHHRIDGGAPGSPSCRPTAASTSSTRGTSDPWRRRAFGNVLVVGLNSDYAVRRRKGASRAVHP
jgi:hypothetical protein